MYQYNLRKEILSFYFYVSHIMLTVLVRNVFNVFCLFVFNVLTEIFFCVIFLKYLSSERVSDFPQEQDGKLCRYKKYFKDYLITVNYSSMHVKRQQYMTIIQHPTLVTEQDRYGNRSRISLGSEVMTNFIISFIIILIIIKY